MGDITKKTFWSLLFLDTEYNKHHRPQRNRVTNKQLENRSVERNVNSTFQVRLEDGNSSIRQNWEETSGLFTTGMRHGINHTSHNTATFLE